MSWRRKETECQIKAYDMRGKVSVLGMYSSALPYRVCEHDQDTACDRRNYLTVAVAIRCVRPEGWPTSTPSPQGPSSFLLASSKATAKRASALLKREEHVTAELHQYRKAHVINVCQQKSEAVKSAMVGSTDRSQFPMADRCS